MYKLFTGTSNSILAKELAVLLKTDLSDLEITRFDNSELRIRVLDYVKGTHALVLQSCSNPTDQNYMELFFIADALKRQGVKNITAIIPYFGYARQDKQHRPGEDVSVEVMIKFIETSYINKVVLINIHEENTLAKFNIPVVHLSAIELLAKKIRSEIVNKNTSLKDFIIVTPDEAGKKRAQQFSDIFFQIKNSEIGIIKKYRDLNKIHISQAVKLIGNIKNKSVIIVDDIVTSSNTLINAADLILKNGANKVFAAVVHHDFSPDAHIKIQNSTIEKFFTTNTIQLKENQKTDKIKEFSVSEIISSVITSSLD
jgi:ribose-phosphate pyrophosphokinase